LLRSLVATTQQQQDRGADSSVVDAVARPLIDPQFPQAPAQRLGVARVAERESGKSNLYPDLRLAIGQRVQPYCKGPLTCGRLVDA